MTWPAAGASMTVCFTELRFDSAREVIPASSQRGTSSALLVPQRVALDQSLVSMTGGWKENFGPVDRVAFERLGRHLLRGCVGIGRVP